MAGGFVLFGATVQEAFPTAPPGRLHGGRGAEADAGLVEGSCISRGCPTRSRPAPLKRSNFPGALLLGACVEFFKSSEPTDMDDIDIEVTEAYSAG
jgi:hypothetical protein